MNDNVVRRTAKKFIKSVNGNVDFLNIEEYLQKLGYKIIFFNTSIGDTELSRYNLQDKSKNTKAFTYNGAAKIIFIDNTCSCEDKKYLLYHELGHILLGHLNYGILSTKNKILLDIEADTFAHEILNLKKNNFIIPLLFIVSISFSLFIGTYIKPINSESGVLPGNNIIQTTYNWVYITATGTKYHTNICTHTKNKNCAKIDRLEAEKIFQPCKMCNP